MMPLRRKLLSLLLWSQRFLKTDMIYASKGGFWMILNQGIFAISYFVLAILFARLLPKETFGTFSYMTSLIAIFSSFSLTGLDTALMQSVARGYEKIVHKAFWIKMRWSIGSSLGSLAVAGYYLLHGNLTIGLGMLAAAFFSPFLYFGSTMSAFLKGRSDFRASSLLSIVQNASYAILMAIALLLFKQPLEIVLSFLVITSVTAVSVFLFALWRYRPNTSDYPEAYRLSHHLSVMNVLTTISGQIDKLTIFHFLGPVSLALYSFAYAPSQQLEALIRIIYNLSLPKFAAMGKKQARTIVLERTPLIVLGAVLIAGTYVILAPYLFRTFFPAYLDSVFFSRLLVLDFVLASIGALAGGFFDSQIMIREKYAVNVAVNIAKLVFIPTFGYFFGVLGVIAGILLVLALSNIMIFSIVAWKQ